MSEDNDTQFELAAWELLRDTRKELTDSLARERQLREALERSPKHTAHDKQECSPAKCFCWVQIRKEALSLPPPPVVAMEDAMTTDTASTHAQRQSNFIP